jgi:hypothetical protein
MISTPPPARSRLARQSDVARPEKPPVQYSAGLSV